MQFSLRRVMPCYGCTHIQPQLLACSVTMPLRPFHTENKCRNSVSQFRTCSILRNFSEEILLMERCDWSIGQCLQTSNEVSTMLAFESLFPM